MKTIVFTMARNESKYLPIWVRYYSKHFQNILVLDHGSNDNSIQEACSIASIQTRRLDHPTFNDFPWYLGTIEATQRDLLTSYDVVLFAEPDELLWHPRGLGEYIETLQHSCVRATGYNIVQMPNEASLDWYQPILSQRSHYAHESFYDKSLLSKIPLRWDGGFHRCSERCVIDNDLILFHLHHVDRGYMMDRAIEKQKWNWDETALKNNFGTYVLDKETMRARMVQMVRRAEHMPSLILESNSF